MAWAAEVPIKVNHHIPKSIKGPTITQRGNGVFMAYIGQGGEKLYTCQCDATLGLFDTWSGNKQVVTQSGKHLETKDRPSIYVPLSEPAIVYIDHNSGHVMQTQRTGMVWNDPVLLSDFSGYAEKWHSPLISIAGLKTVLFVLDSNNNPWYAFQVFQWNPSQPNFSGDNPWTTARPFPRSLMHREEQVGAVDWFASVYRERTDTEYMETVYGVSRNKIYVYRSPLVYDPSYEYPWDYIGSIDLDNQNISITDTPSGTVAVFTAPGSTDINMVYIHPASLTLQGLTKIQAQGNTLSTNSAPSAMYFQSFRATVPSTALCIAYKEAQNDNLCFADNAI